MTELVPEKLIELDAPIELHGKTYDVVQLREPTAAEVIQALKIAGTGLDANHAMMLSLITSVSGLQKQAVEKMPIRRFQEAGEYLLGFMQSTQATTES